MCHLFFFLPFVAYSHSVQKCIIHPWIMHDMNVWAGVKYCKEHLHINIIHQVCERRVCFCAGALKEALPFSSPARIWKSFTRKSFSSTPKPGPHRLFNFYSIMRLYILSFSQLFVLCRLLSMLDLLLGAPLSHCSQSIMGVLPHHWLH